MHERWEFENLVPPMFFFFFDRAESAVPVADKNLWLFFFLMKSTTALQFSMICNEGTVILYSIQDSIPVLPSRLFCPAQDAATVMLRPGRPVSGIRTSSSEFTINRSKCPCMPMST